MYNSQLYDDYIKSILGYPTQNDNVYPSNIYYEMYDSTYRHQKNEELENLYPEIYKIVYPMIRKVCMSNNEAPLTREIIENMVDEIYLSVEYEKVENMEKDRKFKNRDLRDLIKILIIRELLKNKKQNF